MGTCAMERGVAVVIEDDEDIRTTLATVLQQSGFAVYPAASGIEGVQAVEELRPDVVTMDISLPDFDGIEASRRIRTFSDAYLVFVSARSEEADALMGFQAGADEYITKPFRPRELRARITALFRRPRTLHRIRTPRLPVGRGRRTLQPGTPLPARNHTAAPGILEFNHKGLTLNAGTREVTIHGETVNLTRTQFDLLLMLMSNGRNIQTKADLVRKLRNDPYDTGTPATPGEQRAIGVHLGNLRKRLGENSRGPRWIETVRGVGYRLTL